MCSVRPNDDEDQQEKILSQVYDNIPEGRTPLDILKKQDERQCIGKHEDHWGKCSIFVVPKTWTLNLWAVGKAHIRRAIQGHEEALRIYGLCPSLNTLELLHGILKASHQRSLNKYSENEKEDEFPDYTEAPDIVRKSFFFFLKWLRLIKSVSPQQTRHHEWEAEPLFCFMAVTPHLL